MRRLEKVKIILQQFEEVRKDSPEITRIEALRRAIARVKFLEKNKYDDNGEKVPGLIGNYNPKDWTY